MDDITRIQPIKRDTQLALRAEASGQLHALIGEVLVGRETECTIQIASPQVSRYHAKISVSANGVFIEDLESSNGTFVNGNKIHQRTLIGIGDEISFDELSYRVTSARDSAAESTRLSAAALSERKPGLGRLRKGSNSSASANAGKVESQSFDDVLKPAPAHPSEGRRSSQAKLDLDKQKTFGSEPAPKPLGGIGPVPAPKAQEIEDVEAFLRFAGSGLQSQAPVSPKDVSPFGLHKRNKRDSGVASDLGRERAKDTLASPSPGPNSGASQAGLDRDDHDDTDNLSVSNKSKPIGETPRAKFDVPGDTHHRQLESPSAKKSMGPMLERSENVMSQELSSSQVKDLDSSFDRSSAPLNPSNQSAVSDEEQTKFLGLNAINRYVSTNQQFQQDLDLGSGPRLIAMTAPIRGKVFTLASDEDVSCWSIGRDDSADICLRDKVVSREHAWITKLDALYQLRVNETASGISVNGHTCTEADLHHGDRLHLGTMELVFRLNVREIDDNSLNLKRSWLQRLKQMFS